MLFLLIGILLLAAGLLLYIKKSRESMFLLGMCISLMLQFAGILIFIAKKGGYSREIMEFLFFSLEIKSRVQYLLIGLNVIGYMIALGRYLFPFFLLEMAMSYSMISFIRTNPVIKKLAAILPFLSLVIYYPTVFRAVIPASSALQDVVVEFSYGWIILYVIISAALLLHEYFSISMRFCRRQFSQIGVFLLALSMLYLLYCGQDPGQVYRFYSYGYAWNKGIGYMQYSPTVVGYLIIIAVNAICGILGFASLLRYTQGSFQTDREDIVMERKFDTAKTSASVFVHSIKNQLLANRVLYKRVCLELDKPDADLERLREHIRCLQQNNETLISRSEDLYKTVKSQSIRLVPVALQTLGESAMQRFLGKYPEGLVTVDFDQCTDVLADAAYMSEALYNLLTNAWEATVAAGRAHCAVKLISHNERLYTVLEVRDQGVGVPRSEQKRIFEPFYSNKNTNFNWGMGLYYVRSIVKGHLGTLRVESTPGQGASFYIMLPKYRASQGGTGPISKKAAREGL